jgi:hypothetical protein
MRRGESEGRRAEEEGKGRKDGGRTFQEEGGGRRVYGSGPGKSKKYQSRRIRRGQEYFKTRNMW